jgi:hypothetical protein
MTDAALSQSEFADRFERAFAVLDVAVVAGRIPGSVLGFVDRDGRRLVRATGSAQLIPTKRSMTTDTWFDLASLTKVIFTTPRILALAEAGTIDLDAPLITALPDLRQYDVGAWERKVTFRQCLGHQTPFPAVEPIYTYGSDPQLLRAFVLQREWKKGEPVYSDINFILLGLAMERLVGKTIREMDPGQGFAFAADPERAAATEECTWRGPRRQLRGAAGRRSCRLVRHRPLSARFCAGSARRDRRLAPGDIADAQVAIREAHPRLGARLPRLVRRRPVQR